MSAILSLERQKIVEEIQRLPEESLSEVYTLLHYFRLGLETVQRPASAVMSYAGCWQDMPESTYQALLSDITTRRHEAFSRRRGDETISD